MLDHIGVNVSDYESAKAFYALAMEPIAGVGGFSMGDRGPQGAFPFWIGEGRGAPTVGHIAFTATDRATVDAFHAAALAAGGADNGAPGIRELYHPDYYGAYVLTADGLNLEAVCHLPQ